MKLSHSYLTKGGCLLCVNKTKPFCSPHINPNVKIGERRKDSQGVELRAESYIAGTREIILASLSP